MENIILSAVVTGLVEGVKRVGLPNNFVYPVALVFGVVIAFIGIQGIPWREVILNGLTLGLVAVGLYEGGKKVPGISTLLTRGK